MRSSKRRRVTKGKR